MWHVYILRCRDDSLYTGITTDIERRVSEHNQGSRAARYTRSRRPVTLYYSIQVSNRAAASRLEYRIKQLSAAEKLSLIDDDRVLALLDSAGKHPPRIAKSSSSE